MNYARTILLDPVCFAYQRYIENSELWLDSNFRFLQLRLKHMYTVDINTFPEKILNESCKWHISSDRMSYTD